MKERKRWISIGGGGEAWADEIDTVMEELTEEWMDGWVEVVMDGQSRGSVGGEGGKVGAKSLLNTGCSLGRSFNASM